MNKILVRPGVDWERLNGTYKVFIMRRKRLYGTWPSKFHARIERSPFRVMRYGEWKYIQSISIMGEAKWSILMRLDKIE